MATDIHGICDSRFAPVREAFAENFESGEEVGAAMAVTVDGEYVVDLWGGHADRERTQPWEENTIVNVWSCTKAMTALCAHMLVDRGELDVSEPIASYWPEFAANGKEGILVRHALSHQAGLAVFEGVAGRIDTIEGVEGEGLAPRDVYVWLPPGYDADPDRRYPVLYLHDGRATTVRQLLTTFNPSDRHGRTSGLSEDELTALEAFLLGLPLTEQERLELFGG